MAELHFEMVILFTLILSRVILNGFMGFEKSASFGKLESAF